MSIEYIQENKNYYEEKINELNDKIKYYQNKTQRQNKETERLNNIINGMEKFIIYNLDYWNKESSQRSSLIKETLTNTLDALRELKGNKND